MPTPTTVNHVSTTTRVLARSSDTRLLGSRCRGNMGSTSWPLPTHFFNNESQLGSLTKKGGFMIISVINHTNGKVSDEDLQFVIRAINRQIAEDFAPYWSMGATLRLEGRSEKVPSKLEMQDLRGDAILYLWDKIDVDGALGYHDQNARGIPYGFVFMELAKKLGEAWSVTLSHEALELIADPEVNL